LAELAEALPPLGIEDGRVSARGPDSECQWLPPFLEGRVLDANRMDRVFDLAEPSGGQQLGKVARARAGEVRLVMDARVEGRAACQNVPSGPW
jgi:hypothetical protein